MLANLIPLSYNLTITRYQKGSKMPNPSSGPCEPDTFLYTLYGHDITLQVDPVACLVPDEISDAFGVEAAVMLAFSRGKRVLDLGTGSGVFLLSLAANTRSPQGLDLLGLDLDEPSLAAAEQNRRIVSQVLSIEVPIEWIQQDWADLDPAALGHFDLVYFNPPYLVDGETVRSEAAKAPSWMLYAPEEGLAHYRTVLPTLPELLVPGGVALVRVPREEDQFQAVTILLEELLPQMEWRPYFINQIKEVDPEKRIATGITIWDPTSSALPAFMTGAYQPT